jgi:hypothetical protein
VELAELFAVRDAESPPVQLDHVVGLAVEPPEPVKHLYFVYVYVVVVSSAVDVY